MIAQIETDKSRHSATTAKLILAALLTAGLAGCGGSNPASVSVDPSKPDGVYVIQDGRLGRLDEDSDKVVKTWQQRTSLSRDLNFLVIHESVATLPVDADNIALQKVARVRNNVKTNGKIAKAPKAEWVTADVPGYMVPVTVTRNSGNPRALLVSANEPLEPGLYSLTYRAGKQRIGGRFGIGWNSIDKTQYASRYCVDRYLSTPAIYRPCAEHDALETAVLKVHDLRIQKQMVGGKPTLVLEGRLTNASAKQQTVPPLLAVINDKNGRELTRWTFQPKVAQLRPGATISFRTGTQTPPKGTAGVAVLLLDETAQNIEAPPLEQSFLQDTQLSTP
jgi:hypothetical protein